MSILLQNKLLQATEAKLEGNLTPQNRDDYLKIVVAGMQAGLHGGPQSMLAKLKDAKDPINNAAVGAVNLVLILRSHAKGTMPYKAMIPAAMTLMLKALDFVDQLGVVKIDNDALVRASHIFTNTLMARFHITSPMINTAVQRVHGIMQDPQKMELIKRKAGVVQDPRASTPTPMPEE